MARKLASNATDPSVDGRLMAWHEAGTTGILLRGGGEPERLGGAHPALGGRRLAMIAGGQIHVQATSGEPFSLSIPAPGADTVAVSSSWLAWRAREGDRDVV